MHAYLEPAGFFRCLRIVKDKIRQRTLEAYKLETTLMKKIIALAVAAVVAAPAMADLTISASARYQVDNGTHTTASNGTAAVADTRVPLTATAGQTLTANQALGNTQVVAAGTPATGAANADTAVPTNRVLVTVAGSTTAESGLFVSTAATLQMTGAAGVSRDGDNAITIGNPMANVVLGAFEPAGAFNSGADAFQNSAVISGDNTPEGANRTREMTNVGLNITAVEGMTLQLSTDMDSQDDYRLVAGYDFGAASVTAAMTAIDAGDNQSSITASTELGGVALNLSYGKLGDAKSTNINASYMGFSLAVQNDEAADGTDESEVYGAYALANAGGLEGLTVTVGAGQSDVNNVDTRYGVRLDYAF